MLQHGEQVKIKELYEKITTMSFWIKPRHLQKIRVFTLSQSLLKAGHHQEGETALPHFLEATASTASQAQNRKAPQGNSEGEGKMLQPQLQQPSAPCPCASGLNPPQLHTQTGEQGGCSHPSWLQG